MPLIWVSYAQGIAHPLFWALCNCCLRQHGPYTTFSLIPTPCAFYQDEDRARLHAYIESLLAP